MQCRVPGLPAAPALLAGSQLGLAAPGPVLILAVQQLLAHLPGDFPVDLDHPVLLGVVDLEELIHLAVQGLCEGVGGHKLIVFKHVVGDYGVMDRPAVVCHP